MRGLFGRLGAAGDLGAWTADVPGDELAKDFGAVGDEFAEVLPQGVVDGEQGAASSVFAASFPLISHVATVSRGYPPFNMPGLLSIPDATSLGLRADIRA